MEDFARADEAFLTSSTRDVQPISTVDGRPLPRCPGPLSVAAAEAFAALDVPHPRPMTGRRRLFGVGTGKTGTHSLAAIFERDHRAAHEAGAKELMEIIFAVAERTASSQDIRDHLVAHATPASRSTWTPRWSTERWCPTWSPCSREAGTS